MKVVKEQVQQVDESVWGSSNSISAGKVFSTKIQYNCKYTVLMHTT